MMDKRAPRGLRGALWRAAEWTALTAALGWMFIWAWGYYRPVGQSAALARPTLVRRAEAPGNRRAAERDQD
jgi:hypothetical protein